MLGKLIKYDIKAQAKMYIGMYIMLLITSVLLLISTKVADANSGAQLLMVVEKLFQFVYILEMICILIATWIMALLRYRRNMLKDEGYLMHTLPVSAAQLHFSKLIVVTLWYLIDCAVILISACIVIGPGKLCDTIKVYTDVSGTAGVGVGLWIILILFFVVSIVMSNSQIFACLCLGYTSYGNKDLMSFVAYLITYVISQIVSVIVLMGYFLIKTGSLIGEYTTEAAVEAAGVSVITGLLGASLVAMVILAVGFNAVSIWALNKKLNLE